LKTNNGFLMTTFSFYNTMKFLNYTQFNENNNFIYVMLCSPAKI